MIAFREIDDFARVCLTRAMVGASTIRFSEEVLKYSKQASMRGSMISDEPEYADLETAYGMAAWAVVLSVDLRGSTTLAKQHGAKNMFLTMHTYLPTMAELVRRLDGKIVGLRGDGLFAAFGLSNLENGSVHEDTAKSAISSATGCGKAMIEAVEDVINPLLEENDLYSELRIGVGIDVGDIVVTRIGLTDANEVTAYGNAVNNACHYSNRNNEIVLTVAAERLYPTAKGGTMKFAPIQGGYIARFPVGMRKIGPRVNRLTTAMAK